MTKNKKEGIRLQLFAWRHFTKARLRGQCRFFLRDRYSTCASRMTSGAAASASTTTRKKRNGSRAVKRQSPVSRLNPAMRDQVRTIGEKEPVPERRFTPGLRPGVMADVGIGADAEFAAASLHDGAECGEDF